MINKKIKVGLVSFGMSGRIFHAPFIEEHPNFELKLILERTKSDSEKIYPNITIVRSFEALLQDQEVELIVVNSPSYLHFEMAQACLLAGKHVVLEKPMTANSKNGETLIKLAQEQNLVLAVYHNKRLEGGFKTVQKLIDLKKLGELSSCTFAIHRYRPQIGPKAWKETPFPAAGILYDIGSHLIDQCLVLFGWPKALKADLQIQRKHGEVIDYFKIEFIYPNFKATVISDMLTQETKPSILVEGTKGTFVKYGHDPQESKLAELPINWETLGEDVPENYGTLTRESSDVNEKIETEEGNYAYFYQNLYEVLREGKSLLISSKQALDVIKIIEWATQSTEVKKSF